MATLSHRLLGNAVSGGEFGARECGNAGAVHVGPGMARGRRSVADSSRPAHDIDHGGRIVERWQASPRRSQIRISSSTAGDPQVPRADQLDPAALDRASGPLPSSPGYPRPVRRDVAARRRDPGVDHRGGWRWPLLAELWLIGEPSSRGRCSRRVGDTRSQARADILAPCSIEVSTPPPGTTPAQQ
jgi:hypothetical protein